MTLKKLVWLVFSGLLFLLLVSAKDQPSFQLNPTYQSSQHIVFACFLPGSSHVTWVLQFLDELASRGHNVTFITVKENVKYGADYSRLNTVSVDMQHFDTTAFMMQTSSHPDLLSIFPKMLDRLALNWRPGYDNLMKHAEENKVDVFICDHRSDACIDAADQKKIPMVVTSTLAMFPDASTGYINNNILTLNEYTTRDQSIYRRFYNTFILPLTVLPKIKPGLEVLAKIKQEAGLENTHYRTEQKTKHALKIISSLFGIETPRPVGPLIQLVGPILATHYAGLDTTLDTFLTSHRRVVYVAFGQHATPDPFDVTLVLGGLIQQYEKGHIDGIIWSSKYTGTDRFPKSIQSIYSGQHYDLTGCFDDDDDDDKDDPTKKKQGLLNDLLVTRWSPQMAVLMHPSVSVFVSHGGANSLFESLYAGKRVIFYPFFGDQPGTAKQLSDYGVSEYFDHKTNPKVINERVEKVILDKQGTYQHHIRRYQALIQIQAKSAPIKAADLVEEVVFANQGNGDNPFLIPHREDVGQTIPWIKRHNLDIYTIALGMVGLILSLFGFGIYKCVIYGAHLYTRKIKTL